MKVIYKKEKANITFQIITHIKYLIIINNTIQKPINVGGVRGAISLYRQYTFNSNIDRHRTIL